MCEYHTWVRSTRVVVWTRAAVVELPCWQAGGSLLRGRIPPRAAQAQTWHCKHTNERSPVTLYVRIHSACRPNDTLCAVRNQHKNVWTNTNRKIKFLSIPIILAFFHLSWVPTWLGWLKSGLMLVAASIGCLWRSRGTCSSYNSTSTLCLRVIRPHRDNLTFDWFHF